MLKFLPLGVPSLGHCEVTKQSLVKLGRAVRYNPLFAASYLLAMTWDFHCHRSRKKNTRRKPEKASKKKLQ